MESFGNEHYDTHGRLRPRWSELGFQDLGDDEAFLVWTYRCWQQADAPAIAVEHRLASLLRQDRLNALLADLVALFRAFGRDGVMRESLQGFPMLTWREELLLSMLSDAPEVVGVHCDPKAMRCRHGLERHGALVRHPSRIPRGGRDLLELRIARSFGAEWEPPGY